MKYPKNICTQCGLKNNKHTGRDSKYVIGECGWCKRKTLVTSPKHFFFPCPPVRKKVVTQDANDEQLK